MCNSNTDAAVRARSAILVAPQGSGKTSLAPALMRAMCLTNLEDEFDPSVDLDSLPPRTLVLTQSMPAHVPPDFDVLSIDQVRAVLTIRASET